MIKYDDQRSTQRVLSPKNAGLVEEISLLIRQSSPLELLIMLYYIQFKFAQAFHAIFRKR
jgi:hypothetical protein